MHRILCSTGAIIGRPNGRDFRLLTPCKQKLRYDGLEFMMYDTWHDQADELIHFLSCLDMEIPVMHCEKQIGEWIASGDEKDEEQALQLFLINCQMASALGAEKMVLHLWNGIPSDLHFENKLKAYGKLKRLAEKYHLSLTVENVVCAGGDPLSHWMELLKIDPQARFTFDTKMAAFHNQIESMYLPETRFLWEKGHIVHLHLNDYGGEYKDWKQLETLHIGRGRIDFDRLFSFLKEINYQGDFTVEATSFLPDGLIRWEDLNRTADRIRGYL